MLFAAGLTALGWLLIACFVVAAAAAATAFVVMRRRVLAVGFDMDEATNYVWGYLRRDQKQRIAFAHVAAILAAEHDVPVDIGADDLALVLLETARSEGAVLDRSDVEDIIELQEGYAERKGLLS